MSTFDSVFRVLTTTSHMEEMRLRLTKKLESMAALKPGWSYGEGLPVSVSAIAVAKDLVLVASDLGLAADVFPNLDGGCAVAFYRHDERVEASVNPDGSLDLTVEKGFGSEFTELEPRVMDASFRKAIAYATQLLEDTRWKFSASWTSGITTQPAVDTGTSYTEIRPRHRTPRILLTTRGGSQLSWPNARVRTA